MHNIHANHTIDFFTLMNLTRKHITYYHLLLGCILDDHHGSQQKQNQSWLALPHAELVLICLGNCCRSWPWFQSSLPISFGGILSVRFFQAIVWIIGYHPTSTGLTGFCVSTSTIRSLIILKSWPCLWTLPYPFRTLRLAPGHTVAQVSAQHRLLWHLAACRTKVACRAATTAADAPKDTTADDEWRA